MGYSSKSPRDHGIDREGVEGMSDAFVLVSFSAAYVFTGLLLLGVSLGSFDGILNPESRMQKIKVRARR
jgi:hypothetical protein